MGRAVLLTTCVGRTVDVTRTRAVGPMVLVEIGDDETADSVGRAVLLTICVGRTVDVTRTCAVGPMVVVETGDDVVRTEETADSVGRTCCSVGRVVLLIICVGTAVDVTWMRAVGLMVLETGGHVVRL